MLGAPESAFDDYAMKSNMKLLLCGWMSICLCGLMGRAGEDQALRDRVKATIDMFKRSDTTMEKLFKSAAGYVVFPSVTKGALIIGGASGDGLVFEKDKVIGRAKLTQVTIGAQIGGQEYAEVIFFETTNALAHFKESHIELSAQVSAVAASQGSSDNAQYVDGIMIFTEAKTGLMAEASVGGQKLAFVPLK